MELRFHKRSITSNSLSWDIPVVMELHKSRFHNFPNIWIWWDCWIGFYSQKDFWRIHLISMHSYSHWKISTVAVSPVFKVSKEIIKLFSPLWIHLEIVESTGFEASFTLGYIYRVEFWERHFTKLRIENSQWKECLYSLATKFIFNTTSHVSSLPLHYTIFVIAYTTEY